MENIKYQNYILNIFILSVLYILPFIYTTKTADPVLSLRFFVISIIGLILFILTSFIKSTQIENHFFINRNIVYGLMLYFLIATFSLMQSDNIYLGLHDLFKTIIFILFISLTLVVFNDINAIRYFLRSTTISSILLSFVGIMQYYFNLLIIPGGWGWPYGTMGNGNLYSSALYLFLPFILSGAFIFKNRWFTLTNIALFSTLLVIILTQTRAVWLAFIVSFFLITVVIVIDNRVKYFGIVEEISILKIKIISLVTLAAVVIGTISIYKYNPSELPNQTLFSIVNFNETSSMERIIQWEKSIKMFFDNPFQGVGLGHWKIHFPSYGMRGLISEQGYRFNIRPHNDYLWVLTEMGIFGFLSYLWIFIYSLFLSVKTMSKCIKYDLRVINIFFAIGLVGYMLIAFFSFPKERIFHLVFSAVMLGLILSIHQQSFSAHRSVRSNRSKNLMVRLAVVVMFFSTMYSYKYYSNEKKISKSLIYHKNGQWLKLLETLGGIDTRYFILDNTATPLEWYKGVANYTLKNFDTAFNNFQLAYKHNPNHVHVLNNLGTMYHDRGMNTKAIELYKSAISIAPKFIDPAINLSSLYYNSGDYERALNTLNQIDQIDYNPRLESHRERIKKHITRN